MVIFRRLKLAVLLVLFTVLSACGGKDLGSGTDGEVVPPETADAITLTIMKSDGDLSAANDITISATLMEGETALSGKLVTFVLTDSTVATFSPETGTAVTDSTGVATIVVKVTSIAGGVEVTASYDAADSVDIAFNSVGDGVSQVPDEADVTAISLYTSSPQLPSSGAEFVELFAIAKDANNNLLEGVQIDFSSDSGQIEKINNVTGPDGKASAKLKTDGEPENRTIVATAKSGDIVETVDVAVVGTTVTLTGSSSLAINDGNSYIIKVLDSDSKGLANATVMLSLTGTAASGAVAEITIPESITTDSDGQATIIVTGTKGGSNTLVASALGTSTQLVVSVQADSFLFTAFSNSVDNVNPSDETVIPDVILSQTASVTLTWLRSGTAVADGTTVNFTTTRGSLATNSATTVAGKVTAMLTSNDAGKALVTFSGTDNGIDLSNQIEFEFVADVAATIKAQASPNSIGPNGKTSTISVVVRDANGNLVKGKTVDFVLTDVSGGSIFPASAQTDSNGSASTVYTSNGTSAQDAIEIAASVSETPAVMDMVKLTVSDRELFISLGTGNEIAELGTTDYVKEFSIFVTDADSNPVSGVDVTISAIPSHYYKGSWERTYDMSGSFIRWVATYSTGECVNEDANLDGILDVGEDDNSDGKLTPGNIVAADGVVTTDEDGRGVITITYSQSYAHFANIRLIASSQVSGSESATETIFTLPVLGDDVNDEDVVPPTQGLGTIGPFGNAADCSIAD